MDYPTNTNTSQVPQPPPVVPSPNETSRQPSQTVEKKGMSLWLKVLIIIGSIIVFIIVTAVAIGYFAPQVYVALVTNFYFSQAPEASSIANVTPVDITISGNTTIAKTLPTYSYFGINFSVPWKTLVGKKETHTLVALSFENKHAIFVDDGSAYQQLMSGLTSNSPENTQKLQQLYGKENMSSNYSVLNLILSSKQSDITYTTPMQKAAPELVMLMLKPTLLPLATGTKQVAIYRFSYNNIKGFEIHNSTKPSFQLIIFNTKDTAREIIVKGQDVTQNDIDFIISSIQFK